ncbi:hypothetical protein [Comamonas sp. JC664]|uniref:hypothetical protein n=1 Tax=Comamonas sp. JC664 TaxID=2801917 RepID=UPI00366B34D7
MDSTVQPTLAAKAVHVAEQTFNIVITAAPVVQATPTPVPALGGVGMLLLSGVVSRIHRLHAPTEIQLIP